MGKHPSVNRPKALAVHIGGDLRRRRPDGIDRERVGAWIETNVDGAAGPFAYERIAGGRSNLTYSVTDAVGHRWELRRPPMGKALG